MKKNKKTSSVRNGGGIGIGVDRTGGPVIDPTANVLALVEAAVARLDDIAELRDDHHREMAGLREVHQKEIITLYAEFQQKLANAESKRIDANREVDLQSVAVANEKAIAQANVLAAQFATSAEASRNMMASQDTRISVQIKTMGDELNNRLMSLERTAAEGSGRQKVADPMMEELVKKVEAALLVIASGGGRSIGQQAMWGYVAAGIGIILAVAGVVMTFFHVVKT